VRGTGEVSAVPAASIGVPRVDASEGLQYDDTNGDDPGAARFLGPSDRVEAPGRRTTILADSAHYRRLRVRNYTAVELHGGGVGR
jgi:hypothetical protein